MLATKFFSRFLASRAPKSSILSTLREDDLESLRKEIKKEIKAEKKLLVKFKLPIAPRTAVSLYQSEKYQDPASKERFKDLKAVVILKELLNEWNGLSPEEKEKYIQMREQDKKRFKNEFENWYYKVVHNSEVPQEMRDQAERKRAKYLRAGYL